LLATPAMAGRLLTPMKTISILALVCLSASPLLSQGTVFFDNRPSLVGPLGRVLVPPDCSPATGFDYWAQLYSAPNLTGRAEQLTAAGTPVNFRTGENAGYVQLTGVNALGQPIIPVVIVTPFPAGEASVQMRVWAAPFTTWEAAVQSSAFHGETSILRFSATGYPPGGSPNLVGLEWTCVPEPSLAGLGIVGGVIVFLLLRWGSVGCRR